MQSGKTIFLLLLLAGAMGGCYSQTQGASGASALGASDGETDNIYVHVTSEFPAIMNIYVIKSSQRIRLGEINPYGHRSFKLPPDVVMYGSAQFMAVAVGGDGAHVTDMLPVEPGMKLEYRITRHLPASMAVWRSTGEEGESGE